MDNTEILALDQMVEATLAKEAELAKVGQELAARDEQFANFLVQQKRNQDELEVLKETIKEYMLEHGISEHSTNKVELKLSSTGKYKADDLDLVSDDFCKVVRSLDNKKVTAYKDLNGKLPDGVKEAGYRLTMKVKSNEKTN